MVDKCVSLNLPLIRLMVSEKSNFTDGYHHSNFRSCFFGGKGYLKFDISKCQ